MLIRKVALLLFACFGSLKAHHQLSFCVNHIASLFSADKSLAYIYEPGFDIAMDVKTTLTFTDVHFVKAVNIDADWILYSSWDSSEMIFYMFPRSSDVVFVAVQHGDDLDLEFIFESFWEKEIVNVLSVNALTLHVHTYNPIELGNCTDLKPVFLGECHQVQRLPYECLRSDCYKGCRLKVGGIIGPPYVEIDEYDTNLGFEVVLTRIILGKMQLVPVFSLLWSTFGDNGMHMSFGGLQITYLDNKIHQFVYYAAQEEYAVFLLEPKTKEAWINVAVVFGWPIWCCLLGTLLFLIFIYYIGISAWSQSTSFLFIWSILFQTPDRSPPKLHLLYLLWLLGAFIIASSYSSFLLSFMFKPIPGTYLTTIPQIKSAKYPFITPSLDLITISLTGKLSMDRINDPIRCYQVFMEGGYAYINTKRALGYQYKHAEEKQRFYQAVPLYKGYNTFLLRKPSVFSETMQTLLRRLDEFGIVTYHDKYRIFREEPEEKPEFTVITLKHLYLVYSLYATGILLSFVAFVYEVAK